MSRPRRLLAIMAVWAVIMGVGLGVLELVARRMQGYILWSLPLRKPTYFELDKLKIYNRAFYERHPQYFDGWPELPSFFESEIQFPRYRYKPNLRMARRGNRLVPAKTSDEVWWSSNSWGFRGPEFAFEKPAGTIRVVCLGASTTEGSQSDDETYPHFLGETLGPGYEVINAGHHAYGIEDLLALFEQWVLPLRPDIVVFYEAANNISYSEFLEHSPCALDSACWLRHRSSLFRQAYRASAAFTFAVERLGWDRIPPPPIQHGLSTSPNKPSAVHFRTVLRHLVETATREGIRPVMASFITVAHEDLRVSHEDNSLIFRELYHKYYPLTAGEMGRIHDYFNEEIEVVARETGVTFVDAAGRFPRDPRYFPFDLIHLSPEGNRLLADIVAEGVRPLSRLHE